ncbi:MAG: RNA polymerase sigma factor [Polyangiaceae bacterium]
MHNLLPEILEGCRRRERRALGTLARLYRPRLVERLRGHPPTHHRAYVEEIATAALAEGLRELAAGRRGPRQQDDPNLIAWLLDKAIALVVKGCVERRKEAFDVFIRLFTLPVRNLLRRAVRGAASADDLAQLTFLKAIETFLRGGEPIGNPLAWLSTIAMNTARDHFRYEGRRRHDDLGDHHPCAPRRGETPSTLEVLDALAAALDAEGLVDRAIFFGHAYHGIPHRELATTHGLSVDATKQRYRRIRQRVEAQICHALDIRKPHERSEIVDEISHDREIVHSTVTRLQGEGAHHHPLVERKGGEGR